MPSILAKNLVLQDTVAGEVNSNLPQPVGGFTGSEHHNVATAKFDVGTKIQVYDITSKGYSTFVYQQNGTASGVAIAAGQVMCPAGATQNSGLDKSIFTNDPDDCIVGTASIIALSAITDDYFGWFWCGGVAPIGTSNSGIISTTTVETDGNVVVGPVSSIDVAATDQLGLGLATTLKFTNGYSLIADA